MAKFIITTAKEPNTFRFYIARILFSIVAWIGGFGVVVKAQRDNENIIP